MHFGATAEEQRAAEIAAGANSTSEDPKKVLLAIVAIAVGVLAIGTGSSIFGGRRRRHR